MQLSSDILEFCILSCLKKEDLYGYSLNSKLQEKLNISESTLYPILRRLLNQKFLTTYDVNFQGRNRRYYKITNTGIKKQEQFNHEWNELKTNIKTLLEEM